jgi:hypothetical protein
MDINTWLTIVAIYIAILAILPREERNLLQLKLHKVEYGTFLFCFLIVIPFLIQFPRLAHRWPFLWTFTIRNGYSPGSIAFGIFYLLFLWVVVRFLLVKPVGRVNTKIILYFDNALSELPFPQFLSLFVRYSPPKLLRQNWNLYREVVLRPEFLQGISKYRPGFVYDIWKLLQNEEEFKAVFRPFLSNLSSLYYEEIKANDGADTVLSNAPFLQSTIVKNVVKNKKNGLLPLISDFAKQTVRAEKGKPNSVYLAPHSYYHTKGEEGYDLPLFYHVRFVSLMYSTAITNKLDLGPHMHTLYAGIIDEMTNNLSDSIDVNNKGEYPTNYHWLIGEIFSCANRWLEYFGGEHVESFDDPIPKSSHIYFWKPSSYISFIPSCLNFCCNSLYKAVKENRVSLAFVAKLMHYNIFSEYFDHGLKDEMRGSIEENIIRNIPEEYLAEVLDFTLDELFAGTFFDFREKSFSGSDTEVSLQLRLWNYLHRMEKV